MPKITIGKNEIARGWGLDFTSSNATGIEAGVGKYSKSLAISPFRLGKIGHIAPGETFTVLADSSTRVNSLPLNGVVDSAGEAFCILKNARVVQFGVGDVTIDTHNATAHNAHTNLVGEDILAYKNNANEYILYSFYDDTDADVGRRTKTGPAWDDDYLSTVGVQTNGTTLTKGVPHKMKIGPDGNVHITNGQYIAKLDINTNAIDYQALNLGAGFIATDLELDGDWLVIVGYKATSFIASFSQGESRCWFWNTTTPDKYQLIFDLQDNYATAIFKGRFLYAFTSGRNSTTKVKIFNGSNFETIFESAQIGSSPRAGSIDLFQNMPHFVNESGSKLMCLDGEAFHYRTVPTTDGSTSPTDTGMIKNLSTNVLFVGRDKGGSTYDIVRIDTAGYHINADFRSIIRSLPLKSTITKIVIFFSQFGTGASITFSLFKGYKTISIGGTDDFTNKTLTNATLGDISSRSFEVKGAIDMDTFFYNIRFDHTSSSNTAAIVRKVEIHYTSQNKF